MIRLLGVTFGALLAVSQRHNSGVAEEPEQRKGGIRGGYCDQLLRAPRVIGGVDASEAAGEGRAAKCSEGDVRAWAGASSPKLKF